MESDAGLKLKPEKCAFASSEVKYLGFVVSIDGVRPDPDKVKAVSEMEFPKTPKGMIRFLGAVNFYRDFIKNFSHISSVLYKMSQSNQKFRAKRNSHEAIESFNKLKSALLSDPVLSYPDFSLPFIIQCDASSIAIGAVLGQMKPENQNKFLPIMYISRHLTATEQKYSTTERELLSVVFSGKKGKPYIYGRHVTFVTDHKPLVSMKVLKDPMGRIGRLLNKIQDLDFTLVYQPGSTNLTADFLSRPETVVSSVDLYSAELGFTQSVNWKKEQAEDEDLSKIIKFLSDDNFTEEIIRENWSNTPMCSMLLKLRKFFSLVDGILVLVDDGVSRVVVPKKLVTNVLEMFHDIPLAGHRDFERTYTSIRSKYFWIDCRKEIKKFCETCFLCQSKKHLNKVNRAPLKPIIVNTPWSVIGIDIVGPLKCTSNGNIYIIIAICYFTKFCIAAAIRDFTAETTAKFIFNEIICKFGMIFVIISDQGVNFKSKLFVQLCKLCSIKKANSSFYHPAGNGQVERTIRSIKMILTMYVNVSHNNWDDFLQPAIAAYNSAKHSSTKYSPYEMLFGRKHISVADVVLNNPVVLSESDPDSFVSKIKQSLEKINRVVSNNLDEARTRQKAQYDKFVKNSLKFVVGVLVLLTNTRVKPGQSYAFSPRAIGPFQILNVFNDVNFKIRSLKDSSVQVVHYNRLVKFNSRGINFQDVTNERSVPKRCLKVPALQVEKSLDVSNLFDYLLNQQMFLGSNCDSISDSNSDALLEFSMGFNLEENDLGEVRDSFECVPCKRNFSTQSGLKRHQTRMKCLDANESTEVVEQEIVQIESQAVITVDPIQSNFCSFCKRQFKNLRGVQTHQRVKNCHGQI